MNLNKMAASGDAGATLDLKSLTENCCALELLKQNKVKIKPK